MTLPKLTPWIKVNMEEYVYARYVYQKNIFNELTEELPVSGIVSDRLTWTVHFYMAKIPDTYQNFRPLIHNTQINFFSLEDAQKSADKVLSIYFEFMNDNILSII